ncbi:MAG TPA: isoprenylcysteine carboxylmethyltransferase family protein [Bryobacteraceae bacterium]|jgi:protein-S-isoprenylcysteine O-methyltransferase|nr:isoprenylcysteine carboxylmethyltransferase family protein [Bryobacteraceae bacterium]
MEPDLQIFVDAAWVAVGIVWLIGAARTKRTAQAQSSGSRLVHISLATVAFVLLFSPITAIGPLAGRFVPNSAVIAYAGLAMTLAGTGFAIWARVFLGRNWSAIVTIKEQHQLIQSGPYAVVRHPIYSGFLLGLLGSALVLGEVRGLVALPLAFLAWWSKSRLEEKFMRQCFGAEYAAYQQRVKALIPFVI